MPNSSNAPPVNYKSTPGGLTRLRGITGFQFIGLTFTVHGLVAVTFLIPFFFLMLNLKTSSALSLRNDTKHSFTVCRKSVEGAVMDVDGVDLVGMLIYFLITNLPTVGGWSQDKLIGGKYKSHNGRN